MIDGYVVYKPVNTIFYRKIIRTESNGDNSYLRYEFVEIIESILYINLIFE